jgi:hypothetical protein
VRIPERWSKIGRRLFAALVFLHFLALALNALPNSRFVRALYPYYGWYPNKTGQQQVWAMYQHPDRIRGDYELVARLPDGREVHPWGSSRQMSSREVYFVEGVLLGSNNKVADQLFATLRERWPNEPRPNWLAVRRLSRTVNEFGQVPQRGTLAPGKPTKREIERRW